MRLETDSLFDGMMKGLRQAAQMNLKLQQEMLVGWTRLLPGFSGRQSGEANVYEQFRQRWSNAILDAARAQRDLLDQQFNTAISSFEKAMGAANTTNGEQPAAEKPPPRVPQASPPEVITQERLEGYQPYSKNIYQKVAVVTGAASGIGEAVSRELARRGARAVLLIDRNEAVHDVAASINDASGRTAAVAKVGDTTDEAFRKRVFNEMMEEHGLVTICVPAAGITRDALSVRLNRESGQAEFYPIETFRQVTEVNLLAPTYWGIEMVARIAEDRWQRGLKRWEPEEKIQGVIVFLGSVSSQGNKGQIAYAVSKAGLEGAAATLQKEAIFYGVRCGVIHPGFTDTPMVRALGEDALKEYVLPYTQLRRLIRPEEIADAICFMISNSAVSGELWADAGWHPPA